MSTQNSHSRPPAGFVPLAGSKRELLPSSRPAGPIDPAEAASISIRLRSGGNIEELEDDVRELYSRSLANRVYATRAELAEQFGARAEDLDAVEHFAQQHNLVVVHRNAAERTLVISGKLGDLLNAFPANVHWYHHASGAYRGRQGEILIPSDFENVITGIFGYDTRPKHRMLYRQRTLSESGPGGQSGVPSFTFAKRYNFPAQYKGSKLDGAGQRIALIELGGGFRHGDLLIYFKEIGIAPPAVSAISVDHAKNHPTKHGPADGEVMLDIEVAGAVAPKAELAVYFAPNQGNGFLDAVNAAVHDTERKPSVVSISWGGPEDQAEPQALHAFHEIFLEAAKLGVTICVAAGDHGVADLDGAHWDGKIHVDHPAADDLVLACGGTQIDANDADVVWNDEQPFNNSPDGGGWATGGGISVMFPLPNYQKAAGVPVSIASGQPGRGVPDIAMSATGYFARVQGIEGASGGTSAVAPLMAALVALLNQAKAKDVGLLNPFLYANVDKHICKDVTSGDNGIAQVIEGYKARRGWDPCSGLGTPDGTTILENL